MNSITISDLMNGPWKERAIYTCEERAIPHFLDGLKPVQRFLLYSGYKNAYKNYDKVASIASVVAKFGYHHGEASASGALTCMGAYFSNNLPLFDGDGNFGNLLDNSPAAPRYIFAKLAPYIDDLYTDNELLEKNPDEDIKTPLHYLPIIPMVLVNGVKGIATGYATDIPPHDPIDIIQILEDMTKGKPSRKPKPKYYSFNGNVKIYDDHYEITGLYEQVSSTKIKVTELPRSYNASSYETILKKLVEKGTIVSYEDSSRNDKYNFLITLKRGTNWDHDTIIKNLKLMTTHTWNLTTVGMSGKIKEWDSVTDIIDEFYKIRLGFIAKRISLKVEEYELQYNYYFHLLQFVNDVVNGKLILRGIDEDTLSNIILNDYKIPSEYLQKTLDTPVRNFTNNMIDKLKLKIDESKKELQYYKNTNPETEYFKNLETLKKSILKYYKELEQ